MSSAEARRNEGVCLRHRSDLYIGERSSRHGLILRGEMAEAHTSSGRQSEERSPVNGRQTAVGDERRVRAVEESREHNERLEQVLEQTDFEALWPEETLRWASSTFPGRARSPSAEPGASSSSSTRWSIARRRSCWHAPRRTPSRPTLSTTRDTPVSVVSSVRPRSDPASRAGPAGGAGSTRKCRSRRTRRNAAYTTVYEPVSDPGVLTHILASARGRRGARPTRRATGACGRNPSRDGTLALSRFRPVPGA